MKTQRLHSADSVSSASRVRSLDDLLAPLHWLARVSPNLVGHSAGSFESGESPYEIPRFLFVGPKAGADPIRIGIFAAIHGDEPAGAHAVVDFLSILEKHSELAAGYCLFVYPVCNPTGFEDNTRYSRRGRDLNREFWNHSAEPEVAILQREIRHHAFHGIISLHTDDTSEGMYGFARGATLTRHLLQPALAAAEQILPRNRNGVIDGFNARDGIIHEGYGGVLCAPEEIRPQPFEIVLETPHCVPQFLQQKALVLALQSILSEYRKLLAYAPNL